MCNCNKMFAIFILLSIFSNLQAETEPKLGRLPDGRAYRVDSQGLELVDHVAELELTIEEQNKRLNRLEFELEEKNKLISALKQSSNKDINVIESGIIVKEISADDSFAISNKPVNPTLKDTTSSSRISFLEEENRNLKNELIAEKGKLAALNNQLSRITLKNTTLNNKSTEANLYQAQIDSLKTKENEYVSRLDLFKKHNEQLRIEKSELQEKIDSLANNTESSQNLIIVKNLEDKNLELENENADLREKIDQLISEKQSERASISMNNFVQLTSQKSDLKTYFSRVRGMLAERDKRYMLYKQAEGPAGLKVKLNNLRSKRGLTLSQIAGQIDKINSEIEYQNTQHDLEYIAKLIKEDLALLERLSN
jgi:hypothetical protein